METKRKLLAVILALVTLLSMAGSVSASQEKDADDYIQQIMNYYRHHQDAAATDIACLLYELSETNPYKAQDWTSIMDYWRYVNNDMTLYPDVLPDGLPQNESLCIVVMGYALNSDGSMKKELIGRLETALASAQKYPNAYIACTGGGTAKNDRTRTEAGEMSKWLLEKGISKERIIVEDQAFSTVANAINTCKILAEAYPHVTHLAIVTSDYHLPRSCLLFHTQATLTASKGAPLLYVAANGAYQTGRAPESIEIQADNLAQLVGIPINGMPKPALSKLDHITVSGAAQYTTGTEPSLQVIAYYDSGVYRDVSKYATYSGIDLAAAGMQDVTVTYEEDQTAVSSTIQIEMVAPETEAPTVPPTLPPETQPPVIAEPETEAPETEPVPVDVAPSDNRWILPASVIVLLLLAALLIIRRLARIRRRRKIRRRRQAANTIVKEEKIDLPDDDSPLEYI